MTSENILLKHYEVPSSSSALGQMTWQIDPSDVKNSTATYKSQSGQEVVLMSIGWLAREGHVLLEDGSPNYIVKLVRGTE